MSDLLLEVDPDGRWTRLELATVRGILTLHPDLDGTAVHGNVVTPDGVVPLTFAWSPQHRLVVAGEPVAAAPSGPPIARRGTPGPGLIVGRDLAITVARGRRAHCRAAGRPSRPIVAAGGLEDVAVAVVANVVVCYN